MNYRIAIPSYNRIDKLLNKTLKLLKNYKIDDAKIDIFLENEEQFDIYNKNLEDNYNIIITNTTGIGDKRNYLRNYYSNINFCKYVLFIDDDIDKIVDMNNELENLDEFIKLAFNKTNELGLKFWGVCGYNNSFFLKDKITTDLKYIIGAFCGLINHADDTPLSTTFDHFEDYDFSIQHYIRDNGIVRFNNIGLSTKYFGCGGITDSYGGLEKRRLATKEGGEKLVEKYPKCCSLYEKKNYYNIRLKKNPKIY